MTVAADREHVAAPARPTEREPEQQPKQDQEPHRIGDAERRAAAEREEFAAVGAEIENGPAAGNHECEAAADAQHGERHDERLHAEIRDQQAVDEADQPGGQ
ncbi:hypothetical protein OKW34_005253 [Paraburkholderia youngii]